MSYKDNGGAAFPLKEALTSDNEGMTLRDYFAGQALPAILAAPDDGIQAWVPTAKVGSSLTAAEVWAKNAYQIADAMLAERAK